MMFLHVIDFAVAQEVEEPIQMAPSCLVAHTCAERRSLFEGAIVTSTRRCPGYQGFNIMQHTTRLGSSYTEYVLCPCNRPWSILLHYLYCRKSDLVLGSRYRSIVGRL
jgi:hypothetical protein